MGRDHQDYEVRGCTCRRQWEVGKMHKGEAYSRCFLQVMAWTHCVSMLPLHLAHSLSDVILLTKGLVDLHAEGEEETLKVG